MFDRQTAIANGSNVLGVRSSSGIAIVFGSDTRTRRAKEIH
ncbi:hypothetical protein [Baaleninema simplex]|nr:hypothetical protein [Baaleninema simplex]